MATLEINFEAWVDSHGYELSLRKEKGRKSPIVWFEPKGGPFVKLSPLDFHSTLYKQFADIPDDPDAYLDFMYKFGPITYTHSPEYGHGWGEEESFSELKDSKSELHEMIEHWRAGSLKYLERDFRAGVEAKLKPYQNGGLSLRLMPRTLYDALLLQFGQAVSNDRALRACQWCGAWFETGAQSKRTSARFCSDRCRTRFHNDRRLKGAKP